MGAIRNKEKNHGIEESHQEAQEGHEDSAEEDPGKLQFWLFRPSIGRHRRPQKERDVSWGALFAERAPVGAIRREENEHGIEESDQKAQEGQESAAHEESYRRAHRPRKRRHNARQLMQNRWPS